MSPEALRRRMAHGNVYPAERIDAALGNYFRPGNLGALRELALLWVADRVEESLSAYLADHGITETWETRERVVVGITGAPGGDRLIRRAARMAGRVGGDLLGVHVVARRRPRRHDRTRARRASAGSSQELGGTVHEVVGRSRAEALGRVRDQREGDPARARRVAPHPLVRAAPRLVVRRRVATHHRRRLHVIATGTARTSALMPAPSAPADRAAPHRRRLGCPGGGRRHVAHRGARAGPRRHRAVDRPAAVPRARRRGQRARRPARRGRRRGRLVARRQLVPRRAALHAHRSRTPRTSSRSSCSSPSPSPSARSSTSPPGDRTRAPHRPGRGRGARPLGRQARRRPRPAAGADRAPAHHVRARPACAIIAAGRRTDRSPGRRSSGSPDRVLPLRAGDAAWAGHQLALFGRPSPRPTNGFCGCSPISSPSRSRPSELARTPPRPAASPRSTPCAPRCCEPCPTTCAHRWRRSRRWSPACVDDERRLDPRAARRGARDHRLRDRPPQPARRQPPRRQPTPDRRARRRATTDRRGRDVARRRRQPRRSDAGQSTWRCRRRPARSSTPTRRCSSARSPTSSSNAVRYSPAAGIGPRRRRARSGRRSCSVSSTADLASPADQHGKVIAPFQRLGDQTGATASDSACRSPRGSSQAMDATMTLDDTPGGGLTVTLTLPLAGPPASATRDGVGTGDAEGPDVLVVDDEPQIRRALSLNLAARGYEVVEAESGERALARGRVGPSRRRAARPRPDRAWTGSCVIEALRGWSSGADHRAHGPRRRALEGARPRLRRRRLHHQAVRHGRAPGPDPRRAATRASDETDQPTIETVVVPARPRRRAGLRRSGR